MTLSIDSLRAELPSKPFEENTHQLFDTTYKAMMRNAWRGVKDGGTVEHQNMYDKNGNPLSLYTETEDGFKKEVFDEEGNHGVAEWRNDGDGTFTLVRGTGYDSEHNIYYEYLDTNGNDSFDEVSIYMLEEDMTEADFKEVEPKTYKKSVDENYQEFDVQIK